MEYLKIAKYNLEAKPLHPIDFLGCDHGVVFSVFNVIKCKGIYAQAEEQNDENKENMQKLFDVILPLSIKDHSKELINEFTYEELKEITCTIIASSLHVFNSMRTISRSFALFIDQTATRYGKTPIEIMIPRGGYNDLDAYLFNVFIENIAVEKEIIESKKRK